MESFVQSCENGGDDELVFFPGAANPKAFGDNKRLRSCPGQSYQLTHRCMVCCVEYSSADSDM
jgi:hypothetical protein